MFEKTANSEFIQIIARDIPAPKIVASYWKSMKISSYFSHLFHFGKHDIKYRVIASIKLHTVKSIENNIDAELSKKSMEEISLFSNLWLKGYISSEAIYVSLLKASLNIWISIFANDKSEYIILTCFGKYEVIKGRYHTNCIQLITQIHYFNMFWEVWSH